MAENLRIEELRRRVQADPASIAFAQLAEECRRVGSYEEAVEICRNGLASHPDYLSARITLGRALIELGSLDEAKHELDLVIATAPENLPAIRGLAEIFQRKGNLNESLAYFRRALLLAKHDVELEANVDRISQRIELPVAPPAPAPTSSVSVEDLFDFDKLLLELGEDPNQTEVPQAPEARQLPQVLVPEVPSAPDDTFLAIERELRAKEEQRAIEEEAARARALEERRAREEMERLAREEGELLAREEQERVAREEQQRVAREEEELHARLAREEEELRVREEQERLAREEQERLAREEQERLAREREELRARLAREEEELRVREEERRRAEEEQRKADEEQRKADEERRLEEDLARQREEFEAQRRRDEEQRRRDEAERVRLAEDARQAAEQQRQLAVLAELEHWLEAIVSDRDHHASL